MSANVVIQFRRGTASEWSTANPTLAAGELAIETDTNKLKVGDGSTAYNSLTYVSTLEAGVLGDIGNVTLTSEADGDFLRWNGTAWINDAVNLGTDSVGDYVQNLVAGTGVTLADNTGEGATPTVSIGQSVDTSADVTFNSVSANLSGNVTGDVTGDLTGNVTGDVTGNVTGDVTGNVTGDVTGDLTGNADTATALETARTIQVSGDVAGSATFDGTADINISTTVQPDSVALGTDTTGDYVESMSAGTGVTVTGGTGEGSTPVIAIAQSVATTADVTFNSVETTADVIIGGDLTVNGTTTTINTATLEVEDNIVTLNSNVTDAPSTNAGIEIERGTATNVLLRWNETSDIWEFTNDGTTFYPLPTVIDDVSDVNATGASDGDILVYDAANSVWQRTTPDLSLSTGRSDVTITSAQDGDYLRWNGTAWVNDPINLGSDTVGDYVQSLAAGTGVTLADNTGEAATPTVSIGQPVGTADDVQFGTVTANLTGDVTGNADTASALETARTISLSGDVAGSVSFDGTGDVDITATVQANSVALGTDTTGDYVQNLVAGNGVTLTNNSGEGATPTITLDSTANVTFEDVTVNGLLDAAHIHGQLAGPVYLHVKNTSGSTIAKGTPVYATGSVGASGATEVSPSDAATASTMPALGITTAELANNAEGHAVILGVIESMNTNAYSVNTVLYVADGGGLTSTRPTGEDDKIQAIGRVIRQDASTGEILILGAGRANDTPNHLDTDYIDFDTSSYTPTSKPTHTESRVWYDSTNDALRMDTSQTGVDIALGQERALFVYNNSGASIAAGSVVYYTGENAAIPTIGLADASDSDKINVAGVTKATIANGAYGFIIIEGILLGIDLTSYSVGDRLHLSATTPGGLQTTPPTYPNYAVEIAEVLLAADPGCYRVNIVSEVFDDIRIREDARIDGNLTVAGNLSILGTQSTVAVNNLAVDDSWIYLNGGNTIQTTSFSGSGLNDGTLVGHFSGTSSTTYYVRIDGVGTGTGGVDTFEWSTDNFSTTEATGVDLSTSPVALSDGISIEFVATTGHTSGDTWSGTASPVNIDLGIAGNYNDGTYAHTGFFRDTTDGYWKVFDGYTPEVDGDVNTGHASFNLADMQAANFRGDLVGNADTATALETGRTISLSGDVAGSVTFDGTANVDIAATIQANSVALGTDTTGDYVQNLVAGTGVTLSSTTGESDTPTVSIGQAVATSDDVTFNTVTLGTAPTQDSHAVTKSYVDNIASGIDWHEAADLGTAAALPNSPTYSNGTSGVGATLTAGSQARLVVDGTNATTGDRVLVKNQATAYENGIYVVTTQGASGVAAWVLTRVTDFDGGNTGEVVPGEAVLVLGGATNARQGFVVTSTSDPHTIGTDAITFTQFTGTQAFTAGAGLTQTGNTLNIETADTGRIVVNADTIDLGSVAVGSTTGSNTSDFVSSITTDAYGRVTSVETSNVGQSLVTTADVTFNTVAADLTGDVTGNADTASALATARTIQVSGDVAGSATFDGSANINISTIIQADSVALGTDTTGDYVQSLVAGTGVTLADNTGETATPTISIGQPVATTDNVTFAAATLDSIKLTTGGTDAVIDWVTDSVRLSNDGTNYYQILTVNDTFGDLADVDMSTLAPSTGDIAYFDGANWVPYPLTIQNAGNVSTSGEASGDILLYNGTDYANTPHTVANITDVSITAAASGDILLHNGTDWVDTEHTLGNVTNVTLTSEADGEFLKYNGTAWVNASIPEINTLNDVGNVTITSVASGEFLKWDGSAWINASIPEIYTLDDVGNVTITGVTSGEFLKWDGSAWVNASIPEINTLDDVGNVTITGATSGEVLEWDGTAWVNTDILASPSLTGTPTAPTAAAATNTTQVATTEFVQQELAALVDSAPGALDTLNELAAALGDDANFSTTVTNSLALKAPLASPTFTGTVTLPSGTNITAGIVSTTGDRTLALTDAADVVMINSTSARTVTVPTNAAVPFPVGTSITIVRQNTGDVTISQSSGVTVNAAVGKKARARYSAIVLTKYATDTWLLTGDQKA